ncbi:glycosyltransferase family 2 protein [Flavobacterium sp.]|uniref:glycosyltransferase family 2 protein n=1 Tax=Flavobacterium sp. TaxID=239 RepID=UPI001201F74C|nr:glycosyltransferase family 2 protein [Flavobacterium sp.]RZJ70858.1 MAG: glycosyltransferase family 2 protein [Flavobacterium sp.]
MLAIVIPYYKKAFFAETLSSLAAQTDKRFRLYIGDDSSPENPESEIGKYESEIPIHFKKFHENVGGKNLPSQWKRCLDLLADEDWVLVLGDDDVLDPNVVEAFYDKLAKNPKVDVMRFATQKIDASSVATSPVYLHPELETSRDFLFRESRSSLSEYVFRTEKLLENNFRELPLGWYSDVLAVLEVSGFGNVLTINDATVNVRISSQSISGSPAHGKQKLEARAIYYKLLCDNYLEKFLPWQQVLLFEKLDKTYLIRKSNWRLLLQIIALYLRKGRVRQLFSFLSKVVKAVVRNVLGIKNKVHTICV